MSNPSLDLIQTVPRVATLIYQTHQLWQEFQGVPDEIKDLVEHLKILEPMFYDIEVQLSENARVITPAFRNSLELSKQAHRSLEALVRDLQAQLHGKQSLKRKFAVVKVLLKKPVLERLEQGLSRCLTLLQLAIQSYQMAQLTRINTESIAQAVITNMRAQPPPRDPSPISPQTQLYQQPVKRLKPPERRPPIDHREIAEIMSPHGQIVKRNAKRDAQPFKPSKYGQFVLTSAGPTGGWQAKIQLPSWLSQRVYEIMSAPAIAGWMYSYRVYNIIPDDADIIAKVRDGDITGVLELFKARKASPFDKTPHGDSLLHIATEARQYDLCRFFLEMGLQSLIQTPGKDGYSPLDHVIGIVSDLSEMERLGNRSEPKDVAKFRAAQLLVSFVPDEDAIPVDRQFGFVRYYDPGNVDLNIFRDMFMPKYYQRPLRDRLEAIRLAAFIQVNAFTVEKLFSKNEGSVSKLEVEQSARERISMVHSMAILFGCRFPESLMEVEKPPAWLHCWPLDDTWRIISKVLHVATLESLSSVERIVPTSNYEVTSWRGTPLISVIGAALCYILPGTPVDRWDIVFHRCLRKWLEYVIQAGFNLLEYGQRELSLLHNLHDDDLKGAFDADSIEHSQDFPRYPIQRSDLQIWTLCHSRIDPEESRGPQNWLPFRIIDIEIGPQPKDWKLLWAPEFEFLASEFWRWTDTQDSMTGREKMMPGAWVDDIHSY